MPTYSYECLKCGFNFELFSYIKDYIEKPKCESCNSCRTRRMYALDASTQSTTIKKSDSELKTLGDLALRNSERMSEDEKTHLYMKHNSYKENSTEQKQLPTGMSRVKKQAKIKWPGTSGVKKKRNIKK